MKLSRNDKGWNPQMRINLMGIAEDIDRDFISVTPDGSHNFVMFVFVPWLRKIESYIKKEDYAKAIDICVGVLDEIGYRYENGEYWVCRDEFSPTDDICLTVAFYVSQIMDSSTLSKELRDDINKKVSSLTKYTFFAGKEEFDIKKFIVNGCVYPFPEYWKHI